MKHRKLLAYILLSSISCSQVVMAQNIDQPISLIINNNKMENLPMSPIEKDGRVLVPAREIFGPLGADVEWKSYEQKVYIHFQDSLMILEVDSKEVWKDGEILTLDVPASIINGKIMLPLRFISENFGFDVKWDNNKKEVSVNTSLEQSQSNTPNKPSHTTDSKPNEENMPEPEINVISGELNKTPSIYEYNSASNENFTLSSSSKRMISTENVKDNGKEFILSFDDTLENVNVFTSNGKIVIDIKNCKNTLEKQMAFPKNDFVQQVRTSQFTDTDTRIVLDLKAPATFKAKLSSDKKQLILALNTASLSYIQVEELEDRNRIYLEKVFENQVEINQDKNGDLTIFVPNSSIADTINWKNLNGLFIQDVKITNQSNGVQLTVHTTNEPNFIVTNHTDLNENYFGITIDLLKTNYQNISYEKGNHPKILIEKTDGLKIKETSITDDYRNGKIIIDLGANYSEVFKNQTLEVNDYWINKVQVQTDTTTKITIFEKTVLAYNIYEDDKGYMIEFVLPKEKYDRILILDPGHGGTDAGASSGNMVEKTLINNQTKALINLLEKDTSIKTYVTRSEDVYSTLEDRAILANEIQGDFYVSLHYNSFSNPSANGTEMLYHPSKNSLDIKIAQLFQNAFVNELGLTDRKIKSRPELYVLKNTKMPSILIEVAFLSNPKDAALISDPIFIDKAAQVIYDCILETFNTYIPSKKKSYDELIQKTKPRQVSSSKITDVENDYNYEIELLNENLINQQLESFEVIQS